METKVYDLTNEATKTTENKIKGFKLIKTAFTSSSFIW